MSVTKRNSRRYAFGAMVASFALLAAACGADGEDGVATGPEDDEDGGVEDAQEISIALIPWEEGIAVTNMWAVILEEQGYDVTIEDLDVAPTFQGVAQGDVDLFFDAWLPDTHGEYMDEFGDDIEDLGAWFDGATLHLTVPAYVDEVDSIEDLADNGDLFGEEIIGIEAGSGLMQRTQEDVLPGYGLEDWEAIESSTPAMLTELETAIEDEEPIVVTLWRPHPAYAEFDLKDLEDPEGALGEGEQIHTIGRDGFSEDFGTLDGWLSGFTLDADEIADLTFTVVGEYEGDEAEGARAWLAENPEFVERTLGDDAEGLEF